MPQFDPLFPLQSHPCSTGRGPHTLSVEGAWHESGWEGHGYSMIQHVSLAVHVGTLLAAGHLIPLLLFLSSIGRGPHTLSVEGAWHERRWEGHGCLMLFQIALMVQVGTLLAAGLSGLLLLGLSSCELSPPPWSCRGHGLKAGVCSRCVF